MAERELRFRRAPRLLVVRKCLEKDGDALGPLDVVAGRMQAREVGMADEGRYQAGSATTCCVMAPSMTTLVPLTYLASSLTR
jgi:hypothetical protein